MNRRDFYKVTLDNGAVVTGPYNGEDIAGIAVKIGDTEIYYYEIEGLERLRYERKTVGEHSKIGTPHG